jgi:hypothetical protein
MEAKTETKEQELSRLSRIPLFKLQQWANDPHDRFSHRDLSLLLWWKNRENVLSWLEFTMPEIWDQVTALLAHGQVKKAHRVATRALMAKLGPQEEVTFEGLVTMIEQQNVPMPMSDKRGAGIASCYREIGRLKGKKVYLCRSRQDKLFLFCNETRSGVIGLYGKDWDYLNGNSKGVFMIVDKARAHNEGEAKRVWDIFIRGLA